LVVTNLYPNPYQPDRAPFNRQQVRALSAHHPLAVIAPIAWTEEAVARWTTAVHLPADRRVRFDGIPIEHPLYVYPPKVLRSWYGWCMRRAVRPAFTRALTEFRPDLVYATWAYPDGWAAVELGHRAGLPVVIKVHGTDVLGLDAYPGRRRLTIEALRRADGVVAVSQDLARQVLTFGIDPQRVRVVYNGIDAQLFHPGPAGAARTRLGLEGSEPLVLYIGNLVPVKGLEILVEACALLKRAHVRFTCCLIGEGPLKPSLERLIARRQLHPRVRLLGPRPHDQLPDWYRSAAVVVLPSWSEGVPNVLLEAAACGTPFIASRVGGIPEIAHLGAGELVTPGDPRLLADAIGRRLTNSLGPPSESPPLIRSHAKVAAELTGLFTQILRTHRPAGGASCLQA
jgi:glycosyltransferase involved in cell wall biosynthesis